MPRFKKVPALEKGFNILNLLVRSKKPLGINDIARALCYHKGTVFNIIYTLVDLGILEKELDNRFRFGTNLYLLGNAARKSSELLTTVHPFLEEINQKTKLSAFLGIRSGMRAIILDKVDKFFDIKIFSEVGMKLPLLAGAGGVALLAQLSDDEVDDILSKDGLRKFTSNTCLNKRKYKARIKKARKEGIVFEKDEYIEGLLAFALPLKIENLNSPIALWAVGLKHLVKDKDIPANSKYLKEVAKKIEERFPF